MKLYKTVIQVEVLSEDKYIPGSLHDIADDVLLGDCSGIVNVQSQEQLDEVDSFNECAIHGTDMAFFECD
jgi:hypothetical protein